MREELSKFTAFDAMINTGEDKTMTLSPSLPFNSLEIKLNDIGM